MNAQTDLKAHVIEIETDTMTINLRPRSSTATRTEQFAQSKAFVWGTSVPESVMVQPAYTTFGDNAENDKAWRKYNKLEVAAQRDALDEALAALEGVEVARHYADLAPTFSRRAGCSCGCSPGFRLGSKLRANFARWLRDETVDLYITVKPVAQPIAPTSDILLDAFAV